MIAQPYQLYIERIDASKDMARYYAMSIECDLFGRPCLKRRWGRIGTSGQSIVHHFGQEEQAVELFLEILRKKRSRGRGLAEAMRFFSHARPPRDGLSQIAPACIG